VEKKERGDQTKGIEFPHFSNTLKLHALHTHTTKKHFKSCPNLCKLLAECVFLFVFFSLRIVTLTGTRRANFVLGKNGYNYLLPACVGEDCIKIDRFKKKRNLNPHSTTLYLSKRVQNRSKRIPRSVFRTFRMDLLGIRFRATQYARGKDGIVRKRRFFVFRECNPRQHLEALWTRFFKKKKKRTLTPLPPLSLTQKILSMTHNNNRLSSEVTARSPRRN
jgi:hypothetical protein